LDAASCLNCSNYLACPADDNLVSVHGLPFGWFLACIYTLLHFLAM
jgi:hypothetical protein